MFEISWFELVVMILASFRLTHLLVFDEITSFIRKPFLTVIEKENEEGVKEIFVEAKGKGLRKFIGQLLSCYWCTGFWVALAVVLIYFYYPETFLVLLILAVAGAAAIIESKI